MPTCPACHADSTTWPTSGDLSICPACARTLVTEGGAHRVATAADTTALAAGHLSELRRMRGQAVKSMGWPDTGAE